MQCVHGWSYKYPYPMLQMSGMHMSNTVHGLMRNNGHKYLGIVKWPFKCVWVV